MRQLSTEENDPDSAGATGPRLRLDACVALALFALLALGAVGAGAASRGATQAARITPPANTALPTISGTAQVGQTLTAGKGTWSGGTPMTFTYQWQRCNSKCSAISGATAATYVLVVADFGRTLDVQVKASNGGGSATATSNPTATVTAILPANTARPAISGTAQVGKTLSASAGTWTGTAPITFIYQWRRCVGTTCSAITGATSSTYGPTASDVGDTLVARVTASNVAGNTAADSNATAIVTAAPAPPVNTARPAISGTAQVGQTLTASNGTWTGTAPISFVYQWQRCIPTCSTISGATSSSYSPTASDVGDTLVVHVTATNTAGNASADSNPTAAVTPASPPPPTPPVNTTVPAISGTTQVGQTLTASNGAWTGTAPISFAIQWRTCNATTCNPIAGATGSTYSPTTSDVGNTIVVRVTASNTAGNVSADSNPTAVISAAAPTLPVNTIQPVISGTPQVGQTLSTSNGAWTGTAPIGFAYQWQRCTVACTAISGATSSSFSPTASDVGDTLVVHVTATNAGGSAAADSNQTATVTAAPPSPPVNTAAPAISGTPQVGQTLSASNGNWTGTAPISFAYQWQNCTPTCNAISGATTSTYSPTATDLGDTIVVHVTATNPGGSASADSDPTATVTTAAPTPPVNTAKPAISGAAQVGQTLTASTGVWTGGGSLSYAYQWQSCGAPYPSVVGADSPAAYLRLDDASGTTAVNSGSGANGTYLGSPTLGAPGVFPGDPDSSVSFDGVNDAVSMPSFTTAGHPFSLEFWADLKGDGSTGALGYGTLAGFDWAHRILWQTNGGGGGGQLLAWFNNDLFFSTVKASLNSWHHIVYTYDGTTQRFYIDGAPAGSEASTQPSFASPYYVGAYDLGNYMFNGNIDETATYTTALTAAQVQHHYQAGLATGCTAISGATRSTYSPTAGDVGDTIAVHVTAINSAGSASADSSPTATVTPAPPPPPTPPTNTAAPAISGTAQAGQTLTASTGTWTGTAPIGFTYQWRNCAGSTCGAISGATTSTYSPTASDVGDTIVVRVTGTNGGGSAFADSNPTAIVASAGTLPVNTVAPSISGTDQVGQTLSASTGTWSGTGPLNYAYQWQRCGAPYPSVVGADSPAAYLRLDDASGTAAVNSGSGANGTYLGSPTLGQPGAFAGDPDTSVSFDGVNDAVSMPSFTTAGHPFSLEFWADLKGDGSTGAKGYGTLAGFDFAHRILWQTNGGNNGGRLLAWFNNDLFYSTSTASLNTWHHIVYTYDGATQRFYIDGVLAGSEASTQPSFASPYYVGAYDLGNYMFNGNIDDSAAYPTALSSAQVVRHYEAGLATGCSNIVGATAASHLAVPADQYATLHVNVTATNAAGSTSAPSTATAAVAAAPLPSNPVTVENALPGSTAWESPDATGAAVEGYTSQVSSAPGDTVSFHVSTNPVANYRIEIYRLGWYGGDGARLITCLPSCTTDEAGVARTAPAPDANGEVDAGWPVTDSITVPSNWTSGYYLARLKLTTGSQQGAASPVYFIVRAAPGTNSAILVQAPVNTWQAYNGWGGESLYSGLNGGPPAVKVSFNRPGYGQSPLQFEYQAVRFLEREGYDVSYTTNYDLAVDPTELLHHKLIMSVGHDEYWTKAMRDNLTAARDAGVNLMFLGGNDIYWQARYEDNGRTLVEYRSLTTDPDTDPATKTVRWTQLQPPNPQCTLTGLDDLGGLRVDGDPPRDYSLVTSTLTDPWMANTGFAPGATLPDMVGYEWDGIEPGCNTPPLTTFFHYSSALANADSTRYTAPSGATVYSTGSVQFADALDGWAGHDLPPDPRVQQFIRNALTAMTK